MSLLKTRRAAEMAAVLLVLSLFRPMSARAQGMTWPGESLARMIDAAQWRLGSWRANGSVELLNTGYESDIYYGFRDVPTPDFTLAAGGQGQLLIPVGKRIVLDLYEYPQYVFYWNTERERTWNNRLHGRIHVALKKLYFQAGGALSDVRSRLSPELNVNVREKTDSLKGIALWQISRQASLSAVYSGTNHDFGDAEFGGTRLAQTLNRREDVFDGALHFQPRPQIRYFLDGQFALYDFPDPTAPTRDARSYGVFAGFEFLPRSGEIVEAARVQGRLSLGYQKLDLKDPAFTDGSGLSGMANLSIQFARRLSARLLYSRGFQFSVYSGARFYYSTSYGGGLIGRLSRKASLRYELVFGRVQYPAGSGVSQGIPSRYTSHTGSLELRLARDLSLDLIAVLGLRQVEGTDPGRKRNFFGINVRYGRPIGVISTPASGLPQ